MLEKGIIETYTPSIPVKSDTKTIFSQIQLIMLNSHISKWPIDNKNKFTAKLGGLDYQICINQIFCMHSLS